MKHCGSQLSSMRREAQDRNKAKQLSLESEATEATTQEEADRIRLLINTSFTWAPLMIHFQSFQSTRSTSENYMINNKYIPITLCILCINWIKYCSILFLQGQSRSKSVQRTETAWAPEALMARPKAPWKVRDTTGYDSKAVLAFTTRFTTQSLLCSALPMSIPMSCSKMMQDIWIQVLLIWTSQRVDSHKENERPKCAHYCPFPLWFRITQSTKRLGQSIRVESFCSVQLHFTFIEKPAATEQKTQYFPARTEISRKLHKC